MGRSKKRIILLIIIGILLSGTVYGCLLLENAVPETGTPETSIQDANIPAANGPGTANATKSTAFNVVKAMGAGWNLGNTLDSIDNKKRGIAKELKDISPEEYYETYWGNPVTTEGMIDTVASAGFGAIRIPVTYADHMDENFQIRLEWLERVEQVVNYVLDNDVYCIINIHHDSGRGSWSWLNADPDNIDWLEERLRTVWLQIAEHFKEYDDSLLFEGFNEIRDPDGHWSDADISAYNTVNRLNQVFVDTVRSTGHNNISRYLIVKTYAAGMDMKTLDAFVLPNDTVEDRLIVGVHNYGVMQFVWQQQEGSRAKAYSDWYYTRDGKPVEDFIERLNSRFIEKGIPVIIGEMGAHNKGNTVDRVNYVIHYVEAAKKYGIACFWWDDGGLYENADLIHNHTIFDRSKNRWFFPEIADAMIAAAKWG